MSVCIVGKTSKRPGVLNGLGVVNLYASTILDLAPRTLEGVTRTRGDGRGCRQECSPIGNQIRTDPEVVVVGDTAIGIPLNLKG